MLGSAQNGSAICAEALLSEAVLLASRSVHAATRWGASPPARSARIDDALINDGVVAECAERGRALEHAVERPLLAGQEERVEVRFSRRLDCLRLPF